MYVFDRTIYFLFLLLISLFCVANVSTLVENSGNYKYGLPVVINTWNFGNATKRAWEVLYTLNKTAVDAIEAGVTVCEFEQCGLTVGFGGSPDENGETTLDAMIIDGININVGAVGGLRRIKNAVAVARKVLDNTKHTILGGDLATKFAVNMGFPPTSLSTNVSISMWKSWRNNTCQPNFWKDVNPDPTKNCGPYKPENNEISYTVDYRDTSKTKEFSHDTITMLAIDRNGNVAAGGSTNGLTHKIPGRISDTPFPGAGSYADNSVGAASATGDGDVMMRFVPSFLAVEEMRRGASPKQAAQTAIKRIHSHYPNFSGAIIAINMQGTYAAACCGIKTFPFCVANPILKNVTIFEIPCIC